MIYQQFNLLPLLTVQENVMYPMILNGADKKGAKAQASVQLEALGLDKTFFHRFPHTLSGGEQQRVAIARALCSPACIVLTDEPTGSLDSENSDIIMRILKDLAHEKGYLVIIVTHDPSVSAFADECLEMDAGKLKIQAK